MVSVLSLTPCRVVCSLQGTSTDGNGGNEDLGRVRVPTDPAPGRDQLPHDRQREDAHMSKDPDSIEDILADDKMIDDLHGGNPSDGWGKV
jgi:hypothetical protein